MGRLLRGSQIDFLTLAVQPHNLSEAFLAFNLVRRTFLVITAPGRAFALVNEPQVWLLKTLVTHSIGHSPGLC